MILDFNSYSWRWCCGVDCLCRTCCVDDFCVFADLVHVLREKQDTIKSQFLKLSDQ